MRSLIPWDLDDKRLAEASLLALLVAGEILLGFSIAVWPQHLHLLVQAAIGLAVVGFTFIEPLYGLYLFVAAAFTEALFMFGSVSAARVLGMVVLAAWIARSFASDRFHSIVVPRQTWFAVLLVVWSLLSALWAVETERLFGSLVLLTSLLALYVLVINLVNSVSRVQFMLVVVTGVSLVLALLTISRIPIGSTGWGRVDLSDISVTDVNAQAAYFLPGLILLIVLFCHQASAGRRLLLLLGALIIGLAILATASRSAVLALATVLVLGMCIDHKLWKAVLPAALLVAGAALLVPYTAVGRLRTIFMAVDRGGGRLDIWLVALNIIRSRPVLGVGLGAFGTAFDRFLPETRGLVSYIGRGRGSHNIFLNVQSELGVVGLALFAGFLAMTLRNGLRAVSHWRRAGSDDLAALALSVWLSLVAMLVMGLFFDLQYWKLFWVLLALPEAVRRVSVLDGGGAAQR